MIEINFKAKKHMSNFFRRSCFLCKSKTKTVINEELKLYHFGEKQIGYGICSNCGLVMQTVSPTNNELINFYKQNFYFEDFKSPRKSKVDSINRQIRLIKQEMESFPNSVLEVSLMSIYNLLQFRKEGAKILHGVEPSLVLNNKIKNKFNIKIFNNLIEDFSSKINYDLILMSHVLEHLPMYNLAFSETYRILKKGGYLIGSTPFLYQIHSAPNDYFRYTKDFLNLNLRNNNYKNIKIISLGKGPFVASYSLIYPYIKFLPIFRQIIFLIAFALDSFIQIFVRTKLSEIFPIGYLFIGKK